MHSHCIGATGTADHLTLLRLFNVLIDILNQLAKEGDKPMSTVEKVAWHILFTIGKKHGMA